MERHLTSEDARGATSRVAVSAVALASDFRESLTAMDVASARRIVAEALTDGAAPGRLYVEVVRPVLSELSLEGQGMHGRVLAVGCKAIFAELVGALPITERAGPGRAALLSCRTNGIERVDGDLAIDFLEADGWAVQHLHGPEAALSLGPTARPGSVELAVAVVGGPEDALRLAPACTLLRRLPDPPVVLLCDFTGRSDWPTASVALGADAFVSDPQDLVVQAASRLPANGVRRWGVQISRRGDSLVLTPTGRLDLASAERLADVVRSRIGTFARVVIDLRDLAEFSSGGVEDVCGWPDSGSFEDLDLLIVGDSGVRSRLIALGIESAVPLADSTVL